ncbi:MAG: extracellular solute-binding protein, partial [Pseudomonadota bacterium]
GEWWSEVVAAFEEQHPDITIDKQQIAYKDFVNQMTIRFASGRPPEILELGSSSFGEFAAQDWLQPLDDRIKGSSIDGNWSSLQSQIVWDGKNQGLLLMGYGFMLFYNEQLLGDSGVKPPTSFEEFTAAVGAITDRDQGIFGLAAVTTEHPTVVIDFLRFITWQGQELIANGNYNLTDPEVVEAIEVYRHTVGGNAPLGNNSTIARQLFNDGKTGFLIDGPWVWARLASASEDIRPHLKMMPAPFAPKLGGAANSIHIPASLDEAAQDKVWSFIELLAEPEWQRQYMLLTASPPGRVNVLTAEDKRDNPHLEAIATAADGAVPFLPQLEPILSNSNEFSAIIMRAALQVLSTDDPVNEILAEAQSELERAIPLN